MKKTTMSKALVALTLLFGCASAYSQNVKVTPLGSHAGELCASDRATIFEDPSGVRILYDAGQSVTGGNDARLGDIHVVLLSHAHGDHMGDRKMAALNAGSCEKIDTVSAAPHSTTAEIAAAKSAAIVMVSDMGGFIAKKVENILKKPTGQCPQSAGATSVPLAAACLATAHLGGTRVIKTAGAARAVEITIVHASHANHVPRELLSDPEKANLAADNLGLPLGPPTGYVIVFTNGLRAYLSGDTGIHADMKLLIHDFYKPNLAQMNLGSSAVTPEAAAYAMNELVRPASVIISHVNEGATQGGKLLPGSRTAAFIKLVKGRAVHLPLSGRTMEFDGNGKCVSGC
jgi:L-ascorbate metabolism protein UlaG (beta-lactamase superfamily)